MSPEINSSDVSGKIIAGLIVTAIVTIISWIIDRAVASPEFRPVLFAGAVLFIAIGWVVVSKLRLPRRQLSREILSALRWLARQWRYLVIAVLLIPIYVVLYLVYASWWIIASYIVQFALITLAILLLFAPKRATRGLIQKIDFDYFPEKLPHAKGWKLEGTLPKIRRAGFAGKKALAIEQVGRYALDYDVRSDAGEYGKSIEFVAKYKGGVVYAHVNAQSKDHSTPQDSWIQIKVGTSKPEPHPTMKNEWIIYVTPTKLEENWQLFRIDLIDEFKRTFGTEGKSFEGLIGFRVRGNLDLAYISVFES
jgi:hypothetical protein